jgi:Helix-turn-helix family
VSRYPELVATPGPDTARRTWRTLEPLHGLIYFAPEAEAAYAALGLEAVPGYFASRSAPMGAVAADTVVATFYNFSPRLVRHAMAGVWERTSPAAVAAARLAAADAALARLLGDRIRTPELARAADLARRAAERAGSRPEGRPLFAGHVGLPWPDEPHLVLWHAQSLLREFRGDGHVAALLAAGLGPGEALVVHAASGEVPAGALQATRGWSDDEWAEAVAAVAARGWLVDGEPLALSDRGAAHRGEVEAVTDRLALLPYTALSDEECAELRRICRPYSQVVVASGLLGMPSPRQGPTSGTGSPDSR